MPSLADVAASGTANVSRGQRLKQQAMADMTAQEAAQQRAVEWLMSQPDALRRFLQSLEQRVRGASLAELAENPEYVAAVQAGRGQGPLLQNLAADVVGAAGELAPSRMDLATGMMAKVPALAAKMGMVAGPIVYHGTPHTFAPTPENPLGAFDVSKIGTGEGAQAYGYGLYFAESPDVAGAYRSAGGRSRWMIDGNLVAATTTRNTSGPMNYAADALDRFDGDKTKAIEWLNDWGNEGEAKKILQRSKDVEKLKGSLYTVDIPDEMADQMMDWELPFDQQPESVKNRLMNVASQATSVETMGRQQLINALQKMDPNGSYSDADNIAEIGRALSMKELKTLAKNLGLKEYLAASVNDILSGNPTGQSLYLQLATQASGDLMSGQQYVSRLLRESGIPGIKYLDEGSRKVGEGTRNYVVFPGSEKRVKILKREQ